MARIIADRGRQRDGTMFFFSYEMDCGCEIRVDERAMLRHNSPSGVGLASRLARVADAHDCEVVVHHSPERYRREVRQRRQSEEARFLGMDMARGSDATAWLVNWQPRASSVPQVVAPEQEVRRAAERLRGLQVSGVVVDEAIGFKAPEPAKPPEKKPDQPTKLDRFQLLDLD